MENDLFASSPEPGSLAAASLWIEELVLGQVATTIALVAVAIIGFEMLAGRISVRRAAGVVLGCFVLFSSSIVAHGIIDTARGTGEGFRPAASVPSEHSTFPTVSPDANANPFDPYSNNAPPN